MREFVARLRYCRVFALGPRLPGSLFRVLSLRVTQNLMSGWFRVYLDPKSI